MLAGVHLHLHLCIHADVAFCVCRLFLLPMPHMPLCNSRFIWLNDILCYDTYLVWGNPLYPADITPISEVRHKRQQEKAGTLKGFPLKAHEFSSDSPGREVTASQMGSAEACLRVAVRQGWGAGICMLLPRRQRRRARPRLLRGRQHRRRVWTRLCCLLFVLTPPGCFPTSRPCPHAGPCSQIDHQSTDLQRAEGCQG